ncbi:hypothetical protein BLA29_012559, partial [Euroglyphus maynei]
IDALVIKGTQLCRLIKHRRTYQPNVEIPSQLYENVEDVYRTLSLLVDNIYSDSKTLPFIQKHLLLHGHYARFIKIVLKQLDDLVGSSSVNNSGGCSNDEDPFWTNKIDTEHRIIRALEQLGWHHLSCHLQRQIHVKFPNSYRKF